MAAELVQPLTPPARPVRTPLRTGLARVAGAAAASASRALRRGAGEVIGGRITLRIAPAALADLAGDRVAASVSATNGKTTTTRLLAAAISTQVPVVSNAGGANLPSGIVSALGTRPLARTAVLEVDELYLGRLLPELRPRVVAVLNLSRDQLDRTAETRKIAAGWRSALAEVDGQRTTVVANCDDPLVAWAATKAPRAIWVSVGLSWNADARSCPECGALLEVGTERGWNCPSCGLQRPAPDAVLEGSRLLSAGADHRVELALPGRANERNAAIAAVAAQQLGIPLGQALDAMRGLRDIDGRYALLRHEGTQFWLLLAKNPAGWVEAMDMLRGRRNPVLLALNARTADGKDTSWLYDVPFEQLAGRQVIVAGERAADLSLRLAYAGVAHRAVPSLAAAVAASGEAEVDAVGNYTAFQQLRALGRSDCGAPR